MNKNWKVMITAAGLMGLCLSIAILPILDIAVFNCLPDIDWNDNLSGIGQIIYSFINEFIGQSNGYNDFIFFNAYVSASFSHLFFKMLGI
ncbi:MAG: hypothetical protein ACFFC7_26015 [Candidatus Hermodarchaeota archaeon]